MPTPTPDQGISIPNGPDGADAPVAFTNSVAVIEPRLVREYADAADRTARRASVSVNEISSLAAEGRLEVYDGLGDISLYTRSVFAYRRKPADQSLASNTTLTNDNALFAALPTAGIFGFRVLLFYTSPSAADIKFGFTWPAGATARWGGIGLAASGGTTGDVQVGTVTTSGGSLTFGGTGLSVAMNLEGEITMGGTGGNLQLQWAQNTSDPGNTTVHSRSRLIVWRSV